MHYGDSNIDNQRISILFVSLYIYRYIMYLYDLVFRSTQREREREIAIVVCCVIVAWLVVRHVDDFGSP